MTNTHEKRNPEESKVKNARKVEKKKKKRKRKRKKKTKNEKRKRKKKEKEKKKEKKKKKNKMRKKKKTVLLHSHRRAVLQELAGCSRRKPCLRGPCFPASSHCRKDR
jgi:hypothetical protein